MAGEPPSTATVERPIGRWTRWRDVARTTLRLIRSNPTGRFALKVTVGVLGALVVVTGIALIPLPGPGWALVIVGLSIWAIEFVWARHLLQFTRQQLSRWIRWVRSRPWPIRLLIGTVGLAFVSVVALLSIKYSFGVDSWAEVLRYVTTH